VDKLVELHNVDYSKTELVNLAKPDGFIERQVMGWIKRYERAKTEEVAVVEELKTYLKNNVPVSPKQTVIHYDYKLNNALFSKDFKKMTGSFDWEMTTIGNPLTDIGVAMSYWIQDDDPKMLKTGPGKPHVTVKEGFYTRDEFLHDNSTK